VSEAVVELSYDQLRARRGKKWRQYAPDVYPAWIADMDFLTAEPVRHALQDLANNADFGYTSHHGEVPAAFATRMKDRFGWVVEPERVILVADLVQAVTASLLAFSEPGAGVVLTSPSYPPLTAAVRATGRTLVDVPLVHTGGRYELDVDGLRRALARDDVRVLLLCNPHNPTGRVFDHTTLSDVAEIALNSDVTVVSDEIHCDLVYPEATFVPFAVVDPVVAARTVSLHSATKSFNLGGLRCGVMHFGSAELMSRFTATHPDRVLGRPNTFGTVATTVAWQQGQPWLDSILVRLRQNRDMVQRWVSRTPLVSSDPPEGTYFAWLDCTALGLDESAAEFFLREARVALNAGEDFGPAWHDFARLNFAVSSTILSEVLRRLDSAISKNNRQIRASPTMST
jgi:cystathionine beta-lyase